MKTAFFKIRISEEHLVKDQMVLDKFLAAHNIHKFESAFVQDRENFWSVILYYSEIDGVVKENKNSKYTAIDEELNADEIKILDCLKIWRTEKAREQKLPSYFIATNKELLSVAKFRPEKKEELLEIKGFGKHKIENYGSEIIEILGSL